MSATMGRLRRSEVPSDQTWDLSAVFADVEAWRAEIGQADALLAGIEAWQGRLGEGPSVLLGCLRLADDVLALTERVDWYSYNRWAEDQGDPDRQALRSEATALGARVRAALA